MAPADALDTRQVQARKPPDRDARTAPPLLRPGMAVRLQRGRVHRRVQRHRDPLPLPRQHHTDPLDPAPAPLMTSGQDTWSARCVETRTAGAAGGPGKPTGSNPGRAPRSDPTSAPRSALAQRYFIQALALAQAGGDQLLGASILDAMSHQATYTGRFAEAANLARAARTGTAGIVTATLTAHFHTMEARALARLGDAKACDRALAEAVREFERRRPEDDPGWIRYFDEAELAAEFGHCLRDLGRAADAARYASRSVVTDAGAGFVRSDFFATMVLADAHLAAGDLEQACATALRALTAGALIRSGRCVNYLRDFRTQLTRAADATAVTDFNEQARGSRLWQIASRPDKTAA